MPIEFQTTAWAFSKNLITTPLIYLVGPMGGHDCQKVDTLAKQLDTMVLYFCCDKFENDEFESDEFTLL